MVAAFYVGDSNPDVVSLPQNAWEYLLAGVPAVGTVISSGLVNGRYASRQDFETMFSEGLAKGTKLAVFSAMLGYAAGSFF